ncbi:MAG: 9-O-acetylesterase [Pseudomonadota bacterium]|nr:9-O-acetylesterase [Pseudomonadota bacterium]
MLQRDRAVAIWGTAEPGEGITVAFAGTSRSTRADPHGRWWVTLPAMPAGGPYRLSVSGDGGIAAAEDVLVGDVWLCSGQSNMEWPVRSALNGEAELAGARDPRLRILTVPHHTALSPQDRFGGPVAWRAVTPETVGGFPAACYFMARDLRRSEDVPIGAISASWGGTQIRTWTPEAALGAAGAGDAAELLALYRDDPAAASRRFGELWGRWWRERTGDAEGAEPWRDSGRLSWRPFPAIAPWEQWGDPAFAEFNGYVWARRKFSLTAEEAAQGGVLSLGVIDDLDQSWVNGVPVGSSFGWSLERRYAVPPAVLRAGENEIIVNIGDSWGAGGFHGPAERLRLTLADGTVKPLGEGWEYSVGASGIGNPPRAPWDTHAGVSLAYNGMIAPLGGFGLRGVAWYQGESDVGLAGAYADRLRAMMAAWRRQFGRSELPFLIVSLAGFGAPAPQPTASGWAALRNQQRLAAADPHAALVPALDLGERHDIHPPDKQEVGRRLARAARALAYGSREPAAPRVLGARRAGDAIAVDFAGVAGALRAWSGSHAIAFELCGETQASCRFVPAAVSGSTVRLRWDGGPATRVRYGWADYPLVNLYDAADMPAGSFELPID